MNKNIHSRIIVIFVAPVSHCGELALFAVDFSVSYTHLLVVDDERGIVDMIQSYFQTQYDILTAYSGQEAVSYTHL